MTKFSWLFSQWRRGVLVGLVLALSSCIDQPVAPPASGPNATSIRVVEKGSRRDTPWRTMSRAQLASKTREAGGYVFIGFKDAGASEGVDERGRVRASRASVLDAKAQLRAMGLEFEIEFQDMPTVVTRIPVTLLDRILADPRVEYVEPIFPGRRVSQDTSWNVWRVNAPAAWASSTGNGAKLFIIDSGLDYDLIDQSPPAIFGCMPLPENGNDTDGHGTMVAGIASAVNNSTHLIGVAHGVQVYPVKDGNAEPVPSYTACGISVARANDAAAINLSTSFGDAYTAVTDQINAAWNEGIVVVVAAGNDTGAVSYPATLSSAIAVSATTSSDALSSFSNTGTKIELAAPGSNVYTICNNNTVCITSGTSFSAPAVAAAAALLKAYNPYWSAIEIRRRLGAGATDLGASGRDSQFGYGLLNVSGALNAAPLTLGVAIGGPTSHPASHTAEFSATALDGMPPYVTYTWRVNGIIWQQSSSSTFSWSSSENYTVSVTVTDASSATASNSQEVTVCSAFQC